MKLVMVILRMLSVASLASTALAQTVDWRHSPINGNWYTTSPHSFWHAAESWAVARGGHLVTIRSLAENEWIRSTFLQDLQPGQTMWIGFTDEVAEGVFRWTSGEPVVYTNWGSGEPNNLGNLEDWTEVPRTGLWNDQSPYSGYLPQGIVEVHSADCNQNGVPDVAEGGVICTQALELNGLGWVRVTDAPSLDVQGPLTIEAWVRAESESGGLVNKWGDIGINDRSYSIEYRAGGQIQFGLARDDNQLDSAFHDFESGNVPLATWRHVACVYDGASRKTYVDGVLVGERATTGLVHAGTTDLSIGAHLRSNAGPVIGPFQGRIDEVRVWSTARTPTEIRRWINETIGPAQVASHPGLVAAWNFDGTTSDATGLHDGVAQGTISYVSSADIPRLYDCDNDGVNDLQEIAADPLLDVNGNGVPDSCECVATSYCVGAPNSVGPGARIALVGLPSVSLNSMTLLCSQLPPSSSGRFFYGPNQIQVPFGNGYRCVGGATYRLPVTLSGPTGTAARSLDLQNPMPGAPTLLPGSTWNFQYWYRNVAAGGAGFNLSDGLAVRFCP